MSASINGELFQNGKRFPSPFSRILALGYYDGPTEGVLQCGVNGPVFKFKLLAWDEDQDVRVFGLSPLPPNAMDRLVAAFEHRQTPQWPVWTPAWHDDMAPAIEGELQQAGIIEWVIVTDDLAIEIMVAKRVSPMTIDDMKNWSQFLELDTRLHAAVS